TICYVYPVTRYLQRAALGDANLEAEGWRPTLNRMLLAACLSGVALLGTWGTVQQAPAYADKLAKEMVERDPSMSKPPAKEYTQISASLGAVLGTIIAAALGGWLGRRITYFLLCLGSLVIVP